jgi:phenylacetate-coenzyme A ligase PaaK-like adenylate-forming protein
MTLNDMKLRGETATRAFRAMGAHDGRVLMLEEISHSVVHQVMLRGLIGVGSTPVQLGRGFTLRHVRHTIPRLRPSEIVTHPTYAMFLKDLLDNEGVDLRLKKVMLWGEIGGSIRPFRKRVSEAYGAQVFDLYAMQETGVLAAECEANEGLHGFEDRFHYEVIEPSTGEVLGEGEAGELVVTDLSRTAMPLIRYRTGDVTTIERDRCSCGRTHLRLCGIKGKVEHSLRTKDGGMLLPGDIAELIWSNPHLPGNFKMVPDEGVVVETKIKKDMSKYYLEKFGRPPVNVTFERLMPRFYHRTQYMANGDYERLLKEQMRLEV